MGQVRQALTKQLLTSQGLIETADEGGQPFGGTPCLGHTGSEWGAGQTLLET